MENLQESLCDAYIALFDLCHDGSADANGEMVSVKHETAWQIDKIR